MDENDYHVLSPPRENVMTKTFTFAILHFTTAFMVAYSLTGDILVGGAVALVEPAINSVGFYFHELAWSRLAPRRAPLEI